MSIERISDRHMLPLDGLKQASEVEPIQVLVRIGSNWNRTYSGQLMLSCLVNLLCRQTDLVGRINLIGPDAPVSVPLPHRPVRASSLLQEMRELVRWAVGEEVEVLVDAPADDADLVIRIGNDGSTSSTTASELIGLADGWRGWIGDGQHAPREIVMPQCRNPLGPFLAASVLAGEVFKRARGVTRGRAIAAFGYSLWTKTEGWDWQALEDGPSLSGLELPPYYLVGAGAVGQAVAYIHGSTGISNSYVVVIDDDQHDTTNLNRCFLAGLDDRNGKSLKVDVVASFLQSAGVGVFPSRRNLAGYVSAPRNGLHPDLRAREADGKFEVIVSCVDRGTSRQDIQGLWPRLILGGSTNQLTAKAILYDLARGTACLGCHNPPEDDGARLRAFERQVREMSPDVRRAHLAANLAGANLDEALAYVGGPKCGTLGEQAFRQAAMAGNCEFSASFVSMAAGVLVAAQLYRVLLFQDTELANPMMTSLAFLNGRVGHNDIAIDQGCRRCSGNARERFSRLWDLARVVH